ncbi:Cell division topological specificity factor [Buchnera aphidicola (Cinara piceae)]|uniref:Cell division topological specificity factor n=2 Tax=Buchnera aphidicola TaxID=9 RepID=A0A803FTX6_9GAMM|nr:cell division topological specificity factor MinE [Buchnera aphidicola]VFP88362.1 Cell division topological specificity factor [Buchnera aphidicola (Cinara piceae)]
MMILDLFLSKRKYTANLAKKRLQIIIKQSKKNLKEPDYFPQLKNDLLLVIAKYIKIKSNQVSIQIEKNNKNIFILEVNIPNTK